MPRGTPDLAMFLCMLGHLHCCRASPSSPPPAISTPLPTTLDLPLFGQMLDEKPLANHVTSPFLIAMLMSQVWLGARGSTRDEMTPVLGISSSHLSTYRRALWDLKQAKTGVTTSVFDRVYHKSDFTIKPGYLSSLSTYYSSMPKVLPGDVTQAAKEINDLTSEKTQGKIKDLVTEQDLQNVVMVLFGAIYFKGTWLYRFNTSERQRNFLTPSGEKSVTMMELKTELLTGYTSDYQAISLPYKDEDYSLILMMPNQRTLSAIRDLQKKLPTMDIGKVYSRLTKRQETIIMPRFKVEAKYNMPKYFQNIGIRKIFSIMADFSGISDESIFVQDIIQKAMIEVNEEGTTAAAAAVVTFTKSLHIPMVVDRPFLVFVYHKKLNSVLFAAQVADPS